MSAGTQIDWGKYASPQPASQIDFSKYEAKKPQAKEEPSAIPSGSDWLHAAGLPASMEEAELTPKQALRLGAMNILHAADPTYLFRSFAVPMVKEGGRAAKGIWQHGGIPQDMDMVHAASAVNPFAAPVVDRMSELREQGKEGEATATGILGAGTLAAGEVLPRVVPAAAAFKKPLAAVADTLNPDVVGIISPRAAHLLRTIGKVAEALPDTATAKSHPAAQAAVKDAFQELKSQAPTAKMIDVPSRQPQPGPQAQVLRFGENSTNARPGPTAPAGLQELPVVPPEATGQLSELSGNTPLDPKKFYGKTPTKSNLEANQRQLASPTGSTAPGQAPVPAPSAAAAHPPQIMDLLTKPGELTDADMNLLKRYDFNKQAWRTGEAPKTAEDEGLAGLLRESIKLVSEQTATAEGRGAQAEAARAGAKYMNPSPKGKGTAQTPIEETEEGARLMRERAERDARRKTGTLGEMR